MLQTDEGADPRGLVRRMTRPQGLGLLFQRGHEALEYRTLHVDPLGAQADLAGIEKGRARNSGRGRIEIAVGEYDTRVLAAELERYRANSIGGGLHDGRSGRRLRRLFGRLYDYCIAAGERRRYLPRHQ